MNRIYAFFLYPFFFLPFFPILAQGMLPNRLAEEAFVGVILQNARTGEVLYEKNAHHYFRPCSTLKLATAIMALKQLGTDATVKTEWRYHPKEEYLSLKLSGDPHWTPAHLEHSLKRFFKEHPDSIVQSVLIDDLQFNGPAYAQGTTIDDHYYYFSVPIQTVMINKNALSLSLKGNQYEGPVLFSWTDPHPPGALTLITNVLLKDEITCEEEGGLIFDGPSEENNWRISGCVSPADLKKPLKISVKSPRNYLKDWILYTFKQNKRPLPSIQWQPVPSTPSNWHDVHRSKLLSSWVNEILQQSDNTVSDILLKILDNHAGGPGSFASGTQQLKNFMMEFTGIPKDQFTIADGAGDSHYTLLRPFDLARLLHVAYQDPQLYPQLLTFLPRIGEKGTLKKRAQAPDLKSTFIGKTGTMKYHSGLAGYLIRPQSDPLIVVILIGNAHHKTSLIRGWEDTFLLTLRHTPLDALQKTFGPE